MSTRRVVIIFGVLGCIAFQAPEAHTQTGAVGTCAKILWNYVGKPLTGAVIQEGAELLADYFANKLQGTREDEVTISESYIDRLIREYEERGMTECELRRQLEAMYEMDGGWSYYSAETYCPRTGAEGYAEGLPSPEQALTAAIDDCIDHGGVPDCCQRHARLR